MFVDLQVLRVWLRSIIEHVLIIHEALDVVPQPKTTNKQNSNKLRSRFWTIAMTIQLYLPSESRD